MFYPNAVLVILKSKETPVIPVGLAGDGAYKVRTQVQHTAPQELRPLTISMRLARIKMVNDPPETMDSDSLYERSPVIWRRSKIGRPGKEDGAMEVQPLNQKYINTL
ncbi:hypothetical protein [Moorena sp. SIO3I8]|uniref:hypothetical protein n=1 Tax=Moorena sp. SIO3I8 TaxID=2607833 RepID=UPI0013C25BC1|nr:hypothetical protein [Moorena sp. SIO3I8]NEO07249.1 hypothetical protein [Moorena sp. SIO3I8]